MKTMKIWKSIVVMTVAALCLNACDGKDGDWDSMNWKAEAPSGLPRLGEVIVKAAGGELSFACKNYSAPWIDNAVADGVYYYPPREGNDYHTIVAGWFKAEISGNKLRVAFGANETAEERPLQLTVTAGDIFYTFRFLQLSKENGGNDIYH